MHTHAHDHSHPGSGTDRVGRAFQIGIALNVAFVVLELVFGTLAHSLALVSDAGHNFGDVLGLALAGWALGMSRVRPSARRTYGLRRSTILAALANALLLLTAVGAIAWEAVQRFWRPEPVATGMVMVVAASGVVINGVTALLFMRGRRADLNVRGAFVHMAADAGVSLGVVASAFAIRLTGWVWLDPLTSLAIAVTIAIGTWGLLRESIDLAMDAVPTGIEPPVVEAYLKALPGVAAVHDLHIWGMSTTETAMTTHLVMREMPESDELLKRVGEELRDRFGIAHVTIQFEHASTQAPCPQADSEVL